MNNPTPGSKRPASKRRTFTNTRSSRPPRRIGKVTIEHQQSAQKESSLIPAVAVNTVRIVPLGGVEEVGRNMTVVETADDIFILDCGLGFGEEETTPGIDFVLPNTTYLEERRDKIRGIFISHGHLDHIGGLPYLLDRIGNPVIYTRQLTGLMIKRRQEEFALSGPLKIREVETDEVISVGKTHLRFFGVTHTIPDSMGIIIETKWGDVVFTGDIKLDHDGTEPSDIEKKEFSVFKDRQVLALMMDSTNVWQPGFSIPERNVFRTLRDIVNRPAKGRTIIGMFASNIERLMHVIEFAEEAHKKVVVDGRSMRTNIDIVRTMGLLKHRDDTIVAVEDIDHYPPEKLIVLATGAQGDEFASLMRMANKTHKYIRITPKDTVVLSSSVIAGNELPVQKLKDNLSRQGAHIITFHTSDVHTSGHGYREEASWIHRQVKPTFFIPIHGHHYMLRVHADLAVELGMAADHIVIPDNSSIIEIDSGQKIAKLEVKAPDETRVVEGFTVSELSRDLMAERKTLSQEGFCTVVATVDRHTGKLLKSPDIISRGFVYLKSNKELMDQTRLIVRKSVETSMSNSRATDLAQAQEYLGTTVADFLFANTKKRPIVIPVIVSV